MISTALLLLFSSGFILATDGNAQEPASMFDGNQGIASVSDSSECAYSGMLPIGQYMEGWREALKNAPWIKPVVFLLAFLINLFPFLLPDSVKLLVFRYLL